MSLEIAISELTAAEMVVEFIALLQFFFSFILMPLLFDTGKESKESFSTALLGTLISMNVSYLNFKQPTPWTWVAVIYSHLV